MAFVSPDVLRPAARRARYGSLRTCRCGCWRFATPPSAAAACQLFLAACVGPGCACKMAVWRLFMRRRHAWREVMAERQAKQLCVAPATSGYARQNSRAHAAVCFEVTDLPYLSSASAALRYMSVSLVCTGAVPATPYG